MENNLYRLSKNLIIRPTNSNFIKVIANGDVTLTTESWFLALLHQLINMGQFSFKEFQILCQQIHPSANATEIFTSLLATGFIDPDTLEETEHYGTPQYPWEEMGWSCAQIFHENIVFSNFAQGDAEGWKDSTKVFKEINKGGDGPCLAKEYLEFPKISLNEPTDSEYKNFFNVLTSRRTTRRFSKNKKLSLDTVSTILHYSARMMGSLKHHYLGKHVLRTSPSGGARHPVEIYPQILRCSEVEAGNYYYNPLTHKLSHLSTTSEEIVFNMGQKQDGCKSMPIAFIISARFARNNWKYRYSKSYLFTLFDVGHFVQTLILCCEAMGLKCFLTPALNVKLANQHLGIDNVYDECAVYLITAG